MRHRIPHSLAVAIALVLVLLASPLFADTATVKRRSNLRADHDISSDILRLVPPPTTLTVLDSQVQNGYLHVRTAQGEEGWVYAKNVTVLATRAGRSRKPLSARAAKAKTRKSGPCAASLDQCPAVGCDKEGTPHALLNEQKRNSHPADPLVTLTFKELRTLQTSTDKKGVQQGIDIEDRSVLSGLDAGDGKTVREGEAVQVAGFIAPERTLRGGSAESVNCRLTAVHDTDVHIPVVEDAEGSEFDALVVEPIPQDRPAAWNLPLWKRLQSDGTKILVRGQLLYDNLHIVNDDPDHAQGGQPKRFTLWEVHPITGIFECTLESNDCDPERPGDWREVR